jgi:hypothetical protein
MSNHLSDLTVDGRIFEGLNTPTGKRSLIMLNTQSESIKTPEELLDWPIDERLIPPFINDTKEDKVSYRQVLDGVTIRIDPYPGMKEGQKIHAIYSIPNVACHHGCDVIAEGEAGADVLWDAPAVSLVLPGYRIELFFVVTDADNTQRRSRVRTCLITG